MRTYIGRFAPSPTGLLHAGSLVAALASWLDARAHGGRWLLRIEDVDLPRCASGAAQGIAAQLQACGLLPDGPIWHQSRRSDAYHAALARLQDQGLAYPCSCTRKDIAQALHAQGQAPQRHGELRYPGTCRNGPTRPRATCAWRVRTDRIFGPEMALALDKKALNAPFFEASSGLLHWHDRRLGWQRQDVPHTVGDFVLRRADGLWAYQLAVVVDDAAQGITHIVRGQDLADNTPRQIGLQHALGLPHPRYLHTPLVLAPNGDKLSKQSGAAALELPTPSHALAALNAAAAVLGLPPSPGPIAHALGQWVRAWADRWCAAR